VTDEGGQRPVPPPDGPVRKIGPYEQSLRDQSKQIARAVARRTARRRRYRILAVVAALAVLGGGAFGARQLFRGPSSAPSGASTSAVPSHCSDPNTVSIAVPAVMGPALTEAAAALADRPDGPCTTFDLEPTEASVAFRTLGTAARPDAWVTDSSIWLEQAVAAGTKLVATEPFASSAIVVAMTPERARSLQAPPTWKDLTSGTDPVRFPDPSRSTVGLLSLAAATAGQAGDGLSRTVTAAAKAPAGTAEPASLAQAEAAPAVPVAEAALVDHNRARPGDSLTAVAPAEGTAPLEYSLITTSDDATAAASITALADYLRSDDAKKILGEHGFRVPGVPEPTGAEPMVGAVTLAAAPSAPQLAQIRTLWNAAVPQRQVLLALDVSGSMLARTEEGTRLALAQDAVRTAMASLPETSRTALWVFSNHIGVRGDDFHGLTNYGAMADARHRAALEKAIAGVDLTVGGGSGLYDSIYAAYVAAKKYFLAGQTNTVVVVVDGPNEDDYGLSLDALKGKLAVEKDPAKPVQVVIVGIGDSPDADAMASVVKITGGRYIPAAQPQDLRLALVGAVTGS
jgi:ABC-type molybdate transport system substrate-binding protein